jgi:hypothetical protein
MYGPHAGREYRLSAMERQDCPDCRKTAADAAAQAAGIPALEGSPKQIAWAAEIRERALRLLPEDKAEALRPEKSARWWIDNGSRF